MIYYSVTPEWAGRTVYIVGGGPSLEGVNLDQYLLKVPVIAANNAYQLKCADICVFGDERWFLQHKDALAKFPGRVITTKTACRAPFLRHMQEIGSGLSRRPDALAWNTHTGSLCVNLAYLMGASKIVLLGYDMCSQGDKTNWYLNPWSVSADAHANHIRGTQTLADELLRWAPHVQVYTTQHSVLSCWPHVDQQTTLEAALSENEPILAKYDQKTAVSVAIGGDFERISTQIRYNCTQNVHFVEAYSPLDALEKGGETVTYFGPEVRIVGNIDRILNHNVHFGALLGPEKHQLDARFMQWTGPQTWFDRRKRRNLRYPVAQTLQMWAENAGIDWVRLQQCHIGVRCTKDLIEVGL